MEFLVLIVLLVAVVGIERLIFARHSLTHLEYTCDFSTDEATQGDTISLIEVVSNHKWLPVPWLKSEITTTKWLDFAGAQSIVTDQTRFVPSFFVVKSFQKVQRVWHVKCLKRGEFSIQRISLVSTDLIGGSTLTRPATSTSQILILPASIDLAANFISPKYLSGDVLVRRNLIADPFYLAGVREYQPGDSMNKIHWSATAKEGTLMVHRLEYTADQSLTVVLNMQSRAYENDGIIDLDRVEYAICVCASIFDQTVDEQIPVRLLANGSTEAGRTSTASGEYFGEHHVMELKRILAKLQQRSTDDFPTYLNDQFSAIQTSDTVIVTAYINEEIASFVRYKVQSGMKVKIFITGRVNSTDIPDDLEVFCLPELLDTEEGIA